MFVLTEGTEAITRKKDSARRFVGHHGLGPVDIRRLYELQGLSSQLQGVAGDDSTNPLFDAVEGFHQRNGLFRAHYLMF